MSEAAPNSRVNVTIQTGGVALLVVKTHDRSEYQLLLSPEKLNRKNTKQVFLVHENAVVRQGIRLFVEQDEHLEVCGEAEEETTAFKRIGKIKPDAVVLDIAREKGSGLSLIKKIHRTSPSVAILVVTMEDEKIYGERALRAGASGYLMRPRKIEQIVRGLHHVLTGRIFVSDVMADHILSRRIGIDARSDRLSALSNRELEIFHGIGNWKSTREIAESLNLSIKTVEYYREQIKKKLGLATAPDLVKAATEWIKGHNRQNRQSL